MFSYIGDRIRILAASFDSDADVLLVRYTEPLIGTSIKSAMEMFLPRMLPHLVDVSTDRVCNQLLSIGKDAKGSLIGTVTSGRAARSLVPEAFEPGTSVPRELPTRSISHESPQSPGRPQLDPRQENRRPGSAGP